jgi:hypothetical protein
LKFERTTFLKLDRPSNPRLERFSSTFPLFRAKRLLLLGKYPYKKLFSSISVARSPHATDDRRPHSSGAFGPQARISYQKPSFPESAKHRFVTRMKR